MGFRLLIDLEVIDYLEALKRDQRVKLLSHFRAIRDYPGNLSDHMEMHSSGRFLNVSLTAGFAVFYWIDDADRHVKIMKIEPRSGV